MSPADSPFSWVPSPKGMAECCWAWLYTGHVRAVVLARQQTYHGPRCIRVLAASQEQITLPVCRQHSFEMLEATRLLPLLCLRGYLKTISLLLSNSLLSSLCPSQLVSGMPHPSLIKVPRLSSASHFDLSLWSPRKSIYLPRRSLLLLPW